MTKKVKAPKRGQINQFEMPIGISTSNFNCILHSKGAGMQLTRKTKQLLNKKSCLEIAYYLNNVKCKKKITVGEPNTGELYALSKKLGNEQPFVESWEEAYKWLKKGKILIIPVANDVYNSDREKYGYHYIICISEVFMNIGVDLDGVLFDTEELFRVYTEIYDIEVFKSDNKVDNNEELFQVRFDWPKDVKDEFYLKYHDEINEKSPYMPGAIEVLKLLKNQGHTISIVTRRGLSGFETIKDTEDRFKKDGVDFIDNKYYSTEDKAKCCINNNIDILIEDNHNNCIEVAKCGTKVIYLKGATGYLLKDKNIKTLLNFGEIYKFLKEREMLKNKIKHIYHSAVKLDGKIKIYFDPFDLEKGNDEILKDADIICITHNHYDHYSFKDILKIMKDDTVFVFPKNVEDKLIEDLREQNLLEKYENRLLKVTPNNFYEIELKDEIIKFETVESYNIGKNYHKREDENVGYIFNYEGYNVYIAGDTDDIGLDINVDVALIPIGGTYTMSAKEGADYINRINPKYVIPTHYGTIVGNLEDKELFEENLNEWKML